MKKLISLFVTLVVSHSVLGNESPNLFDCMNKNTFAIEGQCIENVIEQNTHFVEITSEIEQKTEWLGGNELATLKFYPNQQLIEVIATLEVANANDEIQ